MSGIDYFSLGRVFEYFPKILAKLPVTLFITVSSLLLGGAIGIGLAAVLLFRPPLLYHLAKVFISFLRAVPVNIQLFLVFYGLPVLLSPILTPLGINIVRANPMWFVVITYAISVSSFLGILMAGAIKGVDSGQLEAGASVGMTNMQVFFRIILPQAGNIALPELASTIVSAFKNTALAFTLGIIDMVGKVNQIATLTHHSLEGQVGVCFIYLILGLSLEGGFTRLQKRLAVYR